LAAGISSRLIDSRNWRERLFKGVRDFLPVSGWFAACLVLYLSLLVYLAVAVMIPGARKRVPWIAGALGFWLVFCAFFFVAGYRAEKNARPAVVVAGETDIRYSPSYEGGIAFRLEEGLRVQVVRTDSSGWKQIRLTREKSGWAEPGAVEEI